MRAPSDANPLQFPIASEQDIVPIRQAVRQSARDLGLGLSQQAKIAAAISTVTRALLAAKRPAMVHMRRLDSPPHQTLEIACILTNTAWVADLAQLKETLRFAELQVLVDTATISLDANEAMLVLCMRLNQAG